MSRTIRVASVLAATTAALGLSIAAPAIASAAPAPASAASAQTQAGLAFYEFDLGGQSVPAYENQACTQIPLDNEGSGLFIPAGSGEVTDGKSTITFYANKDCNPGSEIGVATPGHPADFLLAGAQGYSSTSN